MRVAIIGSRKYPDPHQVCEFVQALATKYPHAVVVSGACPNSPDEWAVTEAKLCGLKVKEYPADWEKHGKKAGFLRNHDIVNDADYVVAFQLGRSRGTQHSIDIAQKLGKNVYIYRPDGTMERAAWNK